MGERCTGHCCKRFHLPFAPDVIQTELRKSNETNTGPKFKDGPFVADMLIYVESEPNPDSNMGHYYTCKHLKDNNCSVYESRPRMCSEYPYGQACKIEGCEWDEGRNPPSPSKELVKLEYAKSETNSNQSV